MIRQKPTPSDSAIVPKSVDPAENGTGSEIPNPPVPLWKRWVSGAILALASSVTAAIIGLSIFYFGMRPVVLHEYGDPLPDVSAFDPGSEGIYLQIPEDFEQKGMHRLAVQTDRGARTVWLWVRDTIAPTATGAERTISTRQTLRPDDLIRDLKDRDLVKVSFSETPPFGTVGDFEPKILLEDVSGNRSSVTAHLFIRVTNEGVTIEAGDEAPAPERFLRDTYDVERCTEITPAMLHTPGTYPITLTVDGAEHESTLTVTDTTAPRAKTQMVVRMPGETVSPDDFLTEITDETAVTATFLSNPDANSRAVQTVGILLTDLGGNTETVYAELLFTHAAPLTIEARTEPLTATECLPAGQAEDTSISETFVPDTVGTHAVTLQVNGAQELALVEVRDTTPPVIEAEDLSWYTNHPLDPSMLCKRIADVTEVTVSTEQPVDWTKEGEQRVTLLAVDQGGNTSSASIVLTLRRDTEPPELYGVVNRTCYVGEPVAYFAEIEALDNLDEELTIEVDHSAVNLNKAGTYPVTYSVTDSDGNTTTASCSFKFVASTVTDEEVQRLADEVLSSILTEGMTPTEQLEAIYDYVRSHVHYVNASDKNDWRKEAVRGIQNGKGDCFTFYAVTRALLDRIDVEYMSVTRKGGRTRHYWVIVNVGTGWYHFDPTYASHHKHRCFMWTNKQCKVKPYFWRFEESNFPPIADVPFDKDAVIAAERARMQTGQTPGDPAVSG